MATASAVNSCTALKIGRSEMIRVMHDEPSFSDIFFKFLLSRSMRTQADLVDQLFNVLVRSERLHRQRPCARSGS